MREHEVFDGAVEWDIVLKEGLCLNRNAPKIERKYFKNGLKQMLVIMNIGHHILSVHNG